MKQQRLMKDSLDLAATKRIAKNIHTVDPSFNQAAFIKAATTGLNDLALKQRVDHIILALHAYLPASFDETASLLQQLPDTWDAGDPNDPYAPFAAWPVIDYVSKYGMKEPDRSLDVLERLTPLFSAEFAIRAFYLNHNDKTYKRALQWCESPNEHVRRLASEGIRLRLPWGKKLPQYHKDPTPILPILTKLNRDPSLYVRKSVANSLNDLATKHPQLALKACAAWQNKAIEETHWIIRRGLRNLIKEGHPKALELLGYTPDPQLKTTFNVLTPTVPFGTALIVDLRVESTSKQIQKIVIDYRIHFVKASGKQAPKVFKLKDLNLSPKTSLSITKKHPFVPATTRKYYPGEHRIDLMVNGAIKASVPFELTL